jgi:hypothetical protein
MLVSANDGSIEHHPFGVGFASENLQNGLPHSSAAPTVEPREHRYPRTEGFRQITPRRSSPMLPENGFDKGTVGKARPSTTPFLRGQQGRQLRPHSIAELTTRHSVPTDIYPGYNTSNKSTSPVVNYDHEFENTP